MHPTHRRSCASREDFHLNYEDGHVACTTPIVAEIFATPIFNENAKEFQDIITNKVRVLLKYHEGNEDTMFFLYQRVLRAKCEEILVIHICEHCNIKHSKVLKTSVFTYEQRNHFDIELKTFRHKWKDRFTNEQYLER